MTTESPRAAGKLAHYDPADQARIKSIMAALVEGRIANGEIPCADEAIRAAMPEAMRDAMAVVNAAMEYLS